MLGKVSSKQRLFTLGETKKAPKKTSTENNAIDLRLGKTLLFSCLAEVRLTAPPSLFARGWGARFIQDINSY